MKLQPMEPHEFFAALVWGGLFLLLLVGIPIQLVAKFRRMKRRRNARICRICGFRFLRKDPHATCPSCGARNE
ncbi:MAG: hypothetical protein Q4F30_01215 [Akkermansia sp.]|nr:hypothetical protein [Akkermansia sp.]